MIFEYEISYYNPNSTQVEKPGFNRFLKNFGVQNQLPTPFLFSYSVQIKCLRYEFLNFDILLHIKFEPKSDRKIVFWVEWL